MKKLLATVLFLTFTINTTFAQTSPVIVTADKVTGNIKELITAVNGTLKYENTTLSADLIIFDRKEKILTAIGNVLFKDENTILLCTELKYYLKTKKAELIDAKGQLSKTDFIKARKLVRVSKKLWIAYDGIYTPCCNCCKRPDWSIEAKEFKVQAGKSFKGKWVAFDIFSVPVILSPVISGPIVEKRTTGFLTPRLGYIKDQGFTIKQPFFLVLGRSADATFYFEKRFNDGNAKGVNFRYVLSPYTTGNIDYNRIDSEDKTEWNISLNHSYLKSDYSYGHIKINIVSSRNFYTESGLQDVEALTSQYTKSDITYSKLWTHALLNTNLVYFDSLDGSSDTTFQKLPEINFYLMDVPFYKDIPLTFSFDSNLTYFYRKVGFRGIRINAKPSLRYTFYTGSVKNSLKLSNLSSLYTIMDNGTDYIYRNLWMYEETHFTNFQIGFKNYKLSISPELSFNFIEKKNQDNIPDFDGTDHIQEEKKVKGSLSFNLYKKQTKLAKLNIDNSYNFYMDENPWQPWKINIELLPEYRIKSSEYIEIDSNTGKTRKINTKIEVNLSKFSLWANHYRSFVENETNNYLRWGAKAKLNRYLTFSYSQRYDFQYHFDRERTYSLSINRNCWNGNLSYHWIKSSDGKITYQITLTINLIKLGGYQYRYEGEKFESTSITGG